MKNYERIDRKELLNLVSNTSWDKIGALLTKLNEESEWMKLDDACHPLTGYQVIIGYKDDTGDYPIYDSTVATYYNVNGEHLWIVDNEFFPYTIEVWRPIPQYNGSKL